MNPKQPKTSRPPSLSKSLSPHPDSSTANSVPRQVSAFARRDGAGHLIKPHAHDRDQLIYAIRGVMTIEALGCIWTIPPSYSLWIPARVQHSVKMDTQVDMRTLYLTTGVVDAPADKCQVRAVSPLLRELIIRAMEIPPLYDEQGADGRLMQVILDEIQRQQELPFSVKLPTDRRLVQIARHMMRSLDESVPIVELGRRAGLSERSIIRRFPAETGLTLHRWRQQARLMRAFVLADEGHSIGAIAQELGYSTPSAFAKMFRKVFGQPPRDFL
jgi:AraC-like DNA-binding protein